MSSPLTLNVCLSSQDIHTHTNTTHTTQTHTHTLDMPPVHLARNSLPGQKILKQPTNYNVCRHCFLFLDAKFNYIIPYLCFVSLTEFFMVLNCFNEFSNFLFTKRNSVYFYLFFICPQVAVI